MNPQQDPQNQAQPATKEQPVVQAPPQNYQAPTPEQQNAPYEQQPVQQQYFAQPNAAPVQYVVAAQSLKGVRGWLLFFVIIAGIASLSYISLFVNGVSNIADGGSALVNTLITPFLLAAAISAIVTIVLEKKLGKYLYTGYIGLSVVYSLILALVDGGEVALIVTNFLVGGLIAGFVALYFHASKRVKETLIK